MRLSIVCLALLASYCVAAQVEDDSSKVPWKKKAPAAQTAAEQTQPRTPRKPRKARPVAKPMDASLLITPPAKAAQTGDTQTGLAVFYGSQMDGRPTASGEKVDHEEFTAAHPSYPLGTRLRVTNLANSKSVVVRINDRGPYAPGRIVGVSYHAAQALDFVKAGTAKVRLEVLPKEQAVASAVKASENP